MSPSGARSAGRRRLATVGVVALALALTACAADPEPATSPSPLVEPEPTATAEPTPTPTEEVAMDRSDEDLGIEFDDLPDVEGDARAALDAYTLFEARFWESLVDGELHPDLEQIAGSEVVDFVSVQVDSNAENGWTVGGESRTTVEKVQASDGIAVVTACNDLSGLTFTKGGTTQPAGDFDMTTTAIEAELSVGTGWQVTSYRVGDPC